jgi:single stranded DNA-binding protein
MSFNRAMLIGNLGDDPELRLLPTGQAEVTFSITTNEAFKSETHERLELHSVVAIGRLAESCNQHLKKGALVYVEGGTSFARVTKHRRHQQTPLHRDLGFARAVSRSGAEGHVRCGHFRESC